ncbi:hypothetical protein EYC84_007662 [Monilinia fructicola]|nr:hypothetical protein EYC84_007662 [Monilinia fructicola]
MFKVLVAPRRQDSATLGLRLPNDVCWPNSCIGMGLNETPVDALTHAYFSFGYITPGDFKVVPMDGLPTEVFTDFTNIKKHNAGLGTVPGSGNMVSTAANRKLFISNLFGLMRKHGFAGIDFDWEYPREGDYGGQPEDVKNSVTFLKKLDDVNNQQP